MPLTPHLNNPSIYGNIMLYAGSSCPELAQEISDHLDVPLSGRDLVKFPNDNLFCRLHSSARGQDVYIIQTTSRPVSDNIMELLIMLQTLKLDSVGRLTAVLPYMAYARSDKKDQPRVPISARLMADMIEVAGADRYMTLDLHAGQIQGFFSIPGDVLTAFHMLSDYFLERKSQMHDPVVVTADLGYAKKGRNFAVKLKVPMAFVEKRRTGPETEALTIIGDVNDHDVIITDDEIDTAGSMVEAFKILKSNGARDVYVSCVHPILSDPATERLRGLGVKEIVVTNTVPIPPEKLLPNMTVLSIAPLLSEVILRAHEGRSVGAMFNE